MNDHMNDHKKGRKSQAKSLTRREFLKIGGVAGVGLVLGGLAQSCAKPTAAPTTAPTTALTAAPTTALTAAPTVVAERKRVVVVPPDATGEKDTMDPAFVVAADDSLNVAAVYNRLLARDQNFVVSPELAESYEPNEDATVWTFHLRQGVKFHDGHELTADDVVYTFKRLADPKSGSPAAAVLAFLTMDSVVAVDKYTVEFRPTGPMVELPVLITNKFTYIVPAGAKTEDLRLHGVGTGPFMTEFFEPGVEPHIFVKNPEYWEPGLPKADELEIRHIMEATTRTAALQAGEIDLATGIDYASIPALKQDPNIKLLASAPSTMITLGMWMDYPPYDDNRVREALKSVVDRQKMVDMVLLGYGTAGNDNPIPPTSPFAFSHEVRPQDIGKAKQLLAEAGYNANNPLKIDFFTGDYVPGVSQIGLLYKEMAAEAGIDVNVIMSPVDTYWDEVWLKQPFSGSYWSARPLGEQLAVAYRCKAAWNETHWCRPDYDALLDKANTTVDDAARAELYKQLQKMLYEEGGLIVPVFSSTVAAMRSKCEGYMPDVQFLYIDLKNFQCG